MTVMNINVPLLPESVASATLAKICKKVGDACQVGDVVAELETDKVMLEIPANHAGVITTILKNVGDEVSENEAILSIDTAQSAKIEMPEVATDTESQPADALRATPSARVMAENNEVSLDDVKGSGRHGIIMRSDVASHTQPAPNTESERVPMSRMRATIADRLVQAKNEMAMLTTFNDVNMQPVMDIRSDLKDAFMESHQVKLGFMSFFVKAVTQAMKAYPLLNASVDGKDIIYHHSCHMGVAVSTDKGLVVPVLRSAEHMSFAEIESGIGALAKKARDQKLTTDDMQGGTFTITNGGVFGSMLSTPIVNPPQSAILGMHRIEKRVVVENDQMVIRPMMYVALSYDHRLIDGSTSVSFLQKVKTLLENPAMLMLDI